MIIKLENLSQSISTLLISRNQITQIENLPQSLTEFDIRHNQIKDLKPLLPLIKKGIDFEAWGNPLENPPMEVARQGIKAIIRYFEELERTEGIQVKEAKLLLTGSGEVGKTSLRYRLNDRSRPLPKQDERTRQVDVDPYRFPLQPEGEFTAQVWDFGGQHIIHHFHRFFMNDSALYLLMTETSKDNKDDFDYWLQTIKLYGKDSPILFVQNQKYGMPRPLDIRPFKEHFNIKEDLFEVNLDTNEGLDSLEKAIQYHIQNLPHTQRTIPRSWLAIREALEGRRAASGGYITYDEFLDICKIQGITERIKMEDVGRFLHRLGVILWYADNDVLRQKVILERHWATEGVFKLVFDKDIQKTGYFSFEQAQNLWDFDQAYCHHAKDLIELMREFKVCFPCKNKEKQYIIPALLTATAPEVAWLSDTRMTVEYHYPTILPRGLVNYLTAEMYRLIDDDTHAWSAGVWLHEGNTQAKIEENYYHRKISITVSGAQHRELFGSIKNTLDSIHKDYPGMSPQLRIPCVCDTCATKPPNEKEYYEYDRIVARLEKGKRTVECDVSYDNVPVEKLLNHILRREDYDKNYQAPKIMKKVFFSYSKKDKTLRDELDRFLAPLKSKIATWHDRDIMPGAKWDAEIKAELNDADIVLCLVSADFLATDYIMEVELPIMLERYKKGELQVIPIILRPCGWEYTTLAEFNALPEKGKPITQYDNKDAAFLEVLNGINRVIKSNI